jgi:hypothetical protein
MLRQLDRMLHNRRISATSDAMYPSGASLRNRVADGVSRCRTLLQRCFRSTLPARTLGAARISAQLCDRLPDQPGLWLRTTKDGAQEFYSVKDQNGRLYAVIGGALPVAVPVARLRGYWVLLE